MATIKTGPDLYRNEFTTDDLAEAREFLGRAYSSRLLMAGVPGGSPVLAVSHIETRAFAVSEVALPADLVFAVDPSDQVIISTVIQGTVQVERGQDIDRYRPGDVLVGSVQHIGPTVRTHGLRNRNVILPLPLLHAVAGTEPGTSPRCASCPPVRPARRPGPSGPPSPSMSTACSPVPTLPSARSSSPAPPGCWPPPR